MRGCYSYNEDLIFFAFDEIVPKEDAIELVEIKMVEPPVEQWYLNSSLLQVAFYRSLAEHCNEYYTAKFARDKYKTKHLSLIGKPLKSILKFGKKTYIVEVIDSEKIIKHYCNKINTIKTLDYEEGEDWDEKFKFKDFDHLKDCFKYTLINTPSNRKNKSDNENKTRKNISG